MFQRTTIIYTKVYEIFSQSEELNYFALREPGYYPRSEETTSPVLYPWGFVEMGTITPVEPYRAPATFTYEFTVNIVFMTMADKGDPRSLVVNDGTNEKKGVLDIASDIGTVLWAKKGSHFDVLGVNDWTISGVRNPSVLNVQRLLIHPLIRGKQIDLVFHMIERGM